MEKNSEMHVNRWVEERLATLSPAGEWQPDATKGLALVRQQQDCRRGRRWIWIAAAGMAACICLVALPGPRAVAQFCLECSTVIWRSVSTSGPEKDRKPAPDFTLNDSSGKPVTLSNYRGKVVLLNFWATWCPPCRVEIPWFNDFQQAYGDRDLAVLGVSLDEDGWKSVKPYLVENKVNYRVMTGNGDVAALYGGVDTLPMTLIIDRQGRIASTHVGLVSRADYQSAIEALIKEAR